MKKSPLFVKISYLFPIFGRANSEGTKSAISKEYNLANFKTKTLMNTLLCTLLYLFFSTPSSNAQFQKVIHQSFEVGEHKNILLNVNLPYEVETWAGNTILTETIVRLENVPPNILEYFIAQGRYQFLEEATGEGIAIKLKELNRNPIRTKHGVCNEQIDIRIFVPEDSKVTRIDNSPKPVLASKDDK